MAGGSGERPGAPPPPPRKARPRGASGIASDASLFEALIGDEPSDAPNLETEWLYEQDGQVFGPISTRVLLERLYEGSLSPDTPVALEDGEFRAIRRIGAFRAHLPKVAAHQAELAEARARQAAEARRLMLRRAGWLALGLAIVGVGSVGVVAFVRHRRAAQAEAERQAKEAALRAELDRLMASVTIEPPLEALVDDRPASTAPGRRRRRRASARGAKSTATGVLTRQEVMRGVRRGFGGFKRCIVEQIQRDPATVGPQIVLTFTIANDGRAKDVSFADRFLRRSEMLGCFQRKMARLQWRTFTGEVRNVEYPISVRR